MTEPAGDEKPKFPKLTILGQVPPHGAPLHIHTEHCNHAERPRASNWNFRNNRAAWFGAGLVAALLGAAAFFTDRLGRRTQPQNAAPEHSEQSRAEDIAYTVNHSLYCTLTDFINPPVNTLTDGYLKWLIPGCGHNHGEDGHVHGPACFHHHHPAPTTGTRWERFTAASKQAFSRERFVQYAKGEFIGDFGAVPITIGIQRLFPHFMQGLRTLAEPIVGSFFRFGAESSSRRWARAQQVALDSPEFREHADAVYEHEMHHFPQAMVWTGASLGLNVGYQMCADKSNVPFAHKLALKTGSVLSGVLVTAGVVVAARALIPHTMRDFDRWQTSNIILPVSRALAGLLGITPETMEKVAKEQQEERSRYWETKVTHRALQAPARAA